MTAPTLLVLLLLLLLLLLKAKQNQATYYERLQMALLQMARLLQMAPLHKQPWHERRVTRAADTGSCIGGRSKITSLTQIIKITENVHLIMQLHRRRLTLLRLQRLPLLRPSGRLHRRRLHRRRLHQRLRWKLLPLLQRKGEPLPFCTQRLPQHWHGQQELRVGPQCAKAAP